MVESKFEVGLKSNMVLFLVAHGFLIPKISIFCMDFWIFNFGQSFLSRTMKINEKFTKIQLIGETINRLTLEEP
jgi:hypothetical protein